MPKTRQSKLEITGLTETVRERFLNGDSFSDIAKAYAGLGITEGMVAGYIFRNRIKRTDEVKAIVDERTRNRLRNLQPSLEPIQLPELLRPTVTVEVEVQAAAKPVVYEARKKPVLPSRESRRFDVMTWNGAETLAMGLSAEDVARRFIPHMTVDRLHMILERDGEIVTTSYLVVLVNEPKP